ncbi:MAG TPA: SRPBCC domain-containing protein [Ohtaekwangia sp.]|nr:SRPBCC domain-containing protein [Ohtaekwangia sp.]
MQVEPGGEWIFVMHGPDGKDYPNRTVFREVVKHKKIVHEHFDPNFIAIIEFERRGDETLLQWYKLYETKALYEMVELHHKSSEGFRQTVARMEAYLDRKGKML